MALSKTAEYLLYIIICTGATSCKPMNVQTSREGGVEMRTRTLAREQIIHRANGVVRQHGRDPKRFHVIYDDGNVAWRSTVKIPVPELQGHDYQLVMYRPRAQQLGGELWVVVDRNTGDELRFIELQ